MPVYPLNFEKPMHRKILHHHFSQIVGCLPSSIYQSASIPRVNHVLFVGLTGSITIAMAFLVLIFAFLATLSSYPQIN
jgi:hypothetical protein